MRDNLIFQKSPEVVFATNTFVNVPVILQHNDTPLIEVVEIVNAGYSAAFNIFDDSGTKLAVAKARQLYLTEEGKRSGLELQHTQDATICTEGKRTVFELTRTAAAAVEAAAELYAPDGTFLMAAPTVPLSAFWEGAPLQLGATVISHNRITDTPIGIQITTQ